MLNTAERLDSETIATYARLCAMLTRHACNRQAIDETTLDPYSAYALALEYRNTEPQISAASARLYRAAVEWALTTEQYPADDLQEAWLVLNPEDSGPEEAERAMTIHEIRSARKRQKPRGSQQRARSMSLKDVRALIGALRSAGGYGPATADWFAATILTGLRPCEWKSAAIDHDHILLCNAKATAGRGFGPTRKLMVSCLNWAERECLLRHLAAAGSAAKDQEFVQFYNNCRDVLRRTSENLWPGRKRYPTLYTARHLFASSAKASLPPEEVAAIMGHGSIKSAPQHYAAARHALGKVRVKPHPENVEAVRARAAQAYVRDRTKDPVDAA